MFASFLIIIKMPFIFLFGWLRSFFTISTKSVNYPIDFVVTWVDNGDVEWKRNKDFYNGDYSKSHNGEERYRDWDNFNYWFRAVERYAPWVNKIYLVTCGHYPSWLNLNHPKLVLVKHADYMAPSNLPTFNSIPIELNFHRIKNLSEHFVYFNDDIFLTADVTPDDFFRNGEPVICSEARPLINTPVNSPFDHQLFSVIGLMNKYDWKECIENASKKWFSHKIGFRLCHNWETYFHGYLSGFYYTHLAQGFRKTTFQNVWDTFGEYLDECSHHKFRRSRDINHWIFTLHEVKDGSYFPVSRDFMGSYYIYIDRDIQKIQKDLCSRKKKMICINDSQQIKSSDFDSIKGKIHKMLEEAFPEKSSFEI